MVYLYNPSAGYNLILKPTTTIIIEATGKLDNNDSTGNIGLVFRGSSNLMRYIVYTTQSKLKGIQIGVNNQYSGNVFNDYKNVFNIRDSETIYLIPYFTVEGVGHAEFYKLTVKW